MRAPTVLLLALTTSIAYAAPTAPASRELAVRGKAPISLHGVHIGIATPPLSTREERTEHDLEERGLGGIVGSSIASSVAASLIPEIISKIEEILSSKKPKTATRSEQLSSSTGVIVERAPLSLGGAAKAVGGGAVKGAGLAFLPDILEKIKKIFD